MSDGSTTRAWNLIVEGHEIERRRIAHRAKKLLFYLDLHVGRPVSLQVEQAMEDLRDAVDEARDGPALVPLEDSKGLVKPSSKP